MCSIQYVLSSCIVQCYISVSSTAQHLPSAPGERGAADEDKPPHTHNFSLLQGDLCLQSGHLCTVALYTVKVDTVLHYNGHFTNFIINYTILTLY